MSKAAAAEAGPGIEAPGRGGRGAARASGPWPWPRRRRVNRRAAAKVAAIIALAVALLSGGCAEPVKEETTDLPTLRELAPGRDNPVLPEPAAAPPPPTHRLLVKRIVFDADDARVDLVLDALAPAEAPRRTLNAWRANGLELRRIPMDGLEMMLANLPRPLNARTIIHQPGPRYAPITLVSKLPPVSRVRLVDQNNRPTTLRLLGGQHRLMVRLEDGDIRRPDAGAALDLLPHHYGPRKTLLPRQPHEKLLDGTSFDQLRISEPLDERTVWVVWSPLHRTAPERGGGSDEPAQPRPETTPRFVAAAPMDGSPEQGDAPAGDAGEGAAGRGDPRSTATARDWAEGPPLLGRAMLTGRQRSQTVRLVLLMTLQPIDADRLPAPPASEARAEPRRKPASAPTPESAAEPDPPPQPKPEPVDSTALPESPGPADDRTGDDPPAPSPSEPR